MAAAIMGAKSGRNPPFSFLRLLLCFLRSWLRELAVTGTRTRKVTLVILVPYGVDTVQMIYIKEQLKGGKLAQQAVGDELE